MICVALANDPRPRAGYQPEEQYGPASYAFEYAVNDEYSGSNYGANEKRDGYETHGEYRVLLPDGRTQIVTYSVLGDEGYVADVRYEGEARPYEAPVRAKKPLYGSSLY